MNLWYALLQKSLSLFVCLLSISGIQVYAQTDPAKADSLYYFIKANPTRAAVYLTQNDTVFTRLNENKLMPLASTVTLLVAIEFAQQSTHEAINENAYVPLEDIEKLYLPYIDSIAFKLWLAYIKANNELINGKVKLVDIARGMIQFGSYTNADYLMDLLGFDSVKDNISLFKLKQHTAIYPFAGSLFSYRIPKKSSEDKLIKALDKYSDKKYSMEAYYNHVDLKQDSTFKETFNPDRFTPRLQKMWYNQLPAATAKEYAQVAEALNNRVVLDEDVFFPIGEVLEYPMEKKENQKLFQHYGAVTGKSPYIFTRVFYVTTKDKVKTTGALFFYNLSPEEVKKLESWQPAFETQCITDVNFRSKLKY